jgi:hypothetical protein
MSKTLVSCITVHSGLPAAESHENRTAVPPRRFRSTFARKLFRIPERTRVAARIPRLRIPGLTSQIPSPPNLRRLGRPPRPAAPLSHRRTMQNPISPSNIDFRLPATPHDQGARAPPILSQPTSRPLQVSTAAGVRHDSWRTLQQSSRRLNCLPPAPEAYGTRLLRPSRPPPTMQVPISPSRPCFSSRRSPQNHG